MLKSIKKTFIIFISTIGVLILIAVISLFALRISSVQTYFTKKVTGYISDRIKTTISVGKVNFTFFNKIELTNVLIEDQMNDTLLFVPSISARIRQFNRNKNTFILGKVLVSMPVMHLRTDSTGLMNINWYLNMLQGKKDSSASAQSYFRVNQVDIVDGTFSLQNKYATPSKTKINLNDIRLAGINAIVENIEVRNDSTYLQIYNLGFRESTGFIIRKLTSDLSVIKQKIYFRNISIVADSSIINSDRICILPDSAESYRKFNSEVRLDISLRKSMINSNDLKYFVTFLDKYNETFWISGDVSGTVSELKGKNIKVTYKNDTYLDCDFDLSGLPDIDNTFIFLDVNDFRSISKDVEQIRIPGRGYILLPEILRKLGVVSFTGNFTGFITDFVTYGKIITNKGIISTDISLRPSGSGIYKVKGLIKFKGIDLGSITENPEMFGGISMEANIDGSANSFEHFALNMSGKIDSIEIIRYKYRNIGLNGLITEKTWDGNIKIQDENIKMDLQGAFDFRQKLPEFDFNMNLYHANLFRLNIDKADSSSSLSLVMEANMKGNTFDNLNGEINLSNSTLIRFRDTLEIRNITARTFQKDDAPAISIRTDFVDGNLYGKYNFSGIKDLMKLKLSQLMPSKFNKPVKEMKAADNNFTFDVSFKNTDELNRFFKTGIILSEKSQINGAIFHDSIISVNAKAKSFSINNNIFNDLTVDGSVNETNSKLIISSPVSALTGLPEITDLRLTFSTVPDNFRFTTSWNNKDKVVNSGNFIAEGQFEKADTGQKNAILKIGILPGEIILRDNLLKIDSSMILIDSSSIKIDRLYIRNKENYLLAAGAISMNPADTMHLEFNGITLDPINRLYERRLSADPNVVRLNIGGVLNGNIAITDVYKHFMFESDITVKDFRILGSHFGNIKIRSIWNNRSRVADLTLSNNLDGLKMFDIKGYFDPKIQQADLNAVANKLPIDFLNPLLKMFASGITGTASGKLHFSGDFNKPVLTGSVMGENASMKIDYLQTRFTFNDSIKLDDKGIQFNNIKSFDDKGNTAIFNGTVFHKYFKDFSVDLTIRENDCMVLNTRPKDNDLFYGTAYASGVTSIKSNGTGLSFNISAKTGKNTKFFIPLKTGNSVSDKSFINFIDKKSANKLPGENKLPVVIPIKTSMDINFDLEITPDAEVQLIFDSKAGDVMKGTGTGYLNISLNPKGEFKMYGDYIIEDGDYLFTLGSLLNKRFVVQSGGKISFNGKMEDAEVDIRAVYKTKASLSDIMPDLLDPKLKKGIPVECQLNLTGNLFKPVVGFDIYLPTADEEVRAYLRSMIKSDEEMSRQFLFLLVMNSFYADPSTRTTQSTSDIGTTTVGVTTTEMLSNQLSNWLSQISNDFDIGINYRPGSTAMPNSNEVEVALSTQILNDQVIINGNFGYGNNQINASGSQNNSAITGAIDIEVKITDKIRFKAFNRSNDNFYIDNGIQYTQGVGLFYKQDFAKFRDLFIRSAEGKKKRMNNPVPVTK